MCGHSWAAFQFDLKMLVRRVEGLGSDGYSPSLVSSLTLFGQRCKQVHHSVGSSKQHHHIIALPACVCVCACACVACLVCVLVLARLCVCVCALLTPQLSLSLPQFMTSRLSMSWSLSPSVRRTRSCCLTVATEARKQLAKGTTYPPAHIHTQRGGHRGHFTLLGSLTPSTTSHNHHNHHNDSRNGVPRCRRSLRRFFDHNLALPFDMVLTMVLNCCTLHPARPAPRHTVHSH